MTDENPASGPVMPPVIFVPRDEIMSTPGLYRAISQTPITWTERLRDTLARKGLDTSTGSRVYCTEVCWGDPTPPGWIFCNAGTGRLADRAFRAYLRAQSETSVNER